MYTYGQYTISSLDMATGGGRAPALARAAGMLSHSPGPLEAMHIYIYIYIYI